MLLLVLYRVVYALNTLQLDFRFFLHVTVLPLKSHGIPGAVMTR